ncbi:cytochrome d ubiquinol oxidase subunit II [Glaciecola siphonariae]|uniref:Cytochrome d ubiquinol oxidase subunit II n=1 Tax=Glaciecola siphonariae TaxID=521012 RepID=A0ABV9LU57_9ALTE
MHYLDANTLAFIFAGLTCFSLLLYAILDGYDLGIGICLPMHNLQWRDKSIAAIGPFWDANETWLVLSIGLLLVAFPAAHSAILYQLYIPTSVLLIGLILRGVAFDFRAKVKQKRQRYWDYVFKTGSLISTFSQGFMLGLYIMGLEYTLASVTFAIFSGVCVSAAYALIGNCFLIMKTSGDLQLYAIKQAKKYGVFTFGGILAVCLINPLVNPSVQQIWIDSPWAILYAAIPLVCFSMLVIGYQVLKRLPLAGDAGNWLPFLITIVVFVSCFAGLVVSFYPYVVPGQLTMFEAASSPESLRIILIGAIIVIPIIFLYTAFTYYAFRGKAEDLRYY